ncbi:hypothetical protein HY643_05060 [Candidatus Woesearchaeota archaeon]|nr:hypothetical protein [Candidatus Woesearchaeota archaeon]
MSLNDVFWQAEKPEEEKKLEVITTEESVLDDLMAYFEQTSNEEWKSVSNKAKEYFDTCLKDLQSFRLTPKTITNFNQKVGKLKENEMQSLGICLSAMIQTSYNHGFNDFEFEEIVADCFGAFLQGTEDNLLKIKAKKIIGVDTLYRAINFSLIAETANGNCVLSFAENGVAEITNHQGIVFGWEMKNCTIYLPNQEVLDKIKKEDYNIGLNVGNNSFVLIDNTLRRDRGVF